MARKKLWFANNKLRLLRLQREALDTMGTKIAPYVTFDAPGISNQ